MIVAERKPISDILQMVSGCQEILLVGCETCVTVCQAGGEKEVSILGSLLRLSFKKKDCKLATQELSIERQCEWEFLEEIERQVRRNDAVISLGCGAGVQAMAAMYTDTPVYPALNTTFLGIPEEQGIWTERCMACGNCMLHKTGGICPMARCAKNIMNGPCGGSQDGKCEIDQESDCGWQLVYDRLMHQGKMEFLQEIEPPRDWSTSRDGGPRKIERKDMIL